jgi:hypothetical protein
MFTMQQINSMRYCADKPSDILNIRNLFNMINYQEHQGKAMLRLFITKCKLFDVRRKVKLMDIFKELECIFS